jgi:REP element-mobilizing transposase RayT
MPRPPRLQFPGAIYHIVTRGDGRRAVFHDDGHYARITKGLADEVQRSAWDVIAYCWMPNHIHLLLRTPEPNLASGMQHWLSGYANWYSKRNRRSGHLFQGRYKSFLVEDDSYFWTLSRYIHLNPCRGARPLAENPDGWAQSSYPGYARKTARNAFVQYDILHEAWRGECGGKDPASAYRRYIAEGLSGATENPLKSALREWVIGSEEFLKRMVALAEGEGKKSRGRLTRRMGAVTIDEVMATVADMHEVEPEEYVGFRSPAAGREMAALLCRRYTNATLAQLSDHFGLGHPDSSANLVRRAKKREEESALFRRQISRAESQLVMKTARQG